MVLRDTGLVAGCRLSVTAKAGHRHGNCYQRGCVMMRLPRAGAITGVAGALVLSSTATFAQAGAAADQSSAASTAQIETVVVTAERRPENLQNVPISITAFSAQDIKDRGASSVRDL